MSSTLWRSTEPEKLRGIQDIPEVFLPRTPMLRSSALSRICQQTTDEDEVSFPRQE